MTGKTEGKGLKTFTVLVRGKAFEDPDAVRPLATRHSERRGSETLTRYGWTPDRLLPIKADAKRIKS